MDWENERYVRLYVRDTIDDAVLSWEARSLWYELLKKFDRSGVLQVGSHGWKGVSIVVRMPAVVVEKAGAELLADGRIEFNSDRIVAPNYIEAQEAKQSDKHRQAESRARRREQARISPDVTKRDDVSQNVTETAENVTAGHTVSHGVTPSLAVPSRAEPSLAKNNTLSENSDPAEGATPSRETIALSATKSKPKKPKPEPSETGRKAAEYLRSQILAVAPNCAAARMTPAALKTWARDLDKLEALSPDHSWKAIRASIDWLHSTPNTFVVQSAASLAKKWDAIQANRRKSSATGAPKPEDPYERAARIRREEASR